MKIQKIIILALSLVLAFLLGYKLAPVSVIISQSKKMILQQKAQALEEVSPSVEIEKKKTFSNEVATSKMQEILAEKKAPLENKETISKLEVQLSSSQGPDWEYEADIVQKKSSSFASELKKDKAPFVKEGKILRPNAFIVKSSPPNLHLPLVDKFLGTSTYTFFNLKNEEDFVGLKVISSLKFVQKNKYFRGSFYYELRDKKNNRICAGSFNGPNQNFLSNPDAPEILILNLSPLIFIGFFEDESGKLAGNYYKKNTTGKSYYRWGETR